MCLLCAGTPVHYEQSGNECYALACMLEVHHDFATRSLALCASSIVLCHIQSFIGNSSSGCHGCRVLCRGPRERARERHYSVYKEASGVRPAPHVANVVKGCTAATATMSDKGAHSKWCSYRSPPGHPCSIAHLKVSSSPYLAADSYASSSHGQSCARAHRKTSKCPFAAAHSHVSSSQLQFCSRAHCNTAKCPFPAASVQRPRIPRAAVRPRPPQHLQVPALSGEMRRLLRSTGSRAPVPTATPPDDHPQPRIDMSPNPTDSHAPAPTSSPPGARSQRRSHTPLIPRDVVLPRPLQHLQVPGHSG